MCAVTFCLTFSPLLIAVEVVTSSCRSVRVSQCDFQSAFNRGRGCNKNLQTQCNVQRIFQSAFNRGRGCNRRNPCHRGTFCGFQSAFNRGRGCNTVLIAIATIYYRPFSPLLIAVEVVTLILSPCFRAASLSVRF